MTGTNQLRLINARTCVCCLAAIELAGNMPCVVLALSGTCTCGKVHVARLKTIEQRECLRNG